MSYIQQSPPWSRQVETVDHPSNHEHLGYHGCFQDYNGKCELYLQKKNMYTDIHKMFYRISEGHWPVYEFQADNQSTRLSFQVFPVGIQMISERIFCACCNIEFALYWTNKRRGMSFVTPGLYNSNNMQNKESDIFF